MISEVHTPIIAYLLYHSVVLHYYRVWCHMYLALDLISQNHDIIAWHRVDHVWYHNCGLKCCNFRLWYHNIAALVAEDHEISTAQHQCRLCVIRHVQSYCKHKELPCRAYSLLNEFFTYTFEGYLLFQLFTIWKLCWITARWPTYSTSKNTLGTRQSCPMFWYWVSRQKNVLA